MKNQSIDSPLQTLEEPLLDTTEKEEKPVEENKQNLTTLEEVRSILELAVGFFLYSLSWILIKTTDSALLGVRHPISDSVLLVDLFVAYWNHVLGSRFPLRPLYFL